VLDHQAGAAIANEWRKNGYRRSHCYEHAVLLRSQVSRHQDEIGRLNDELRAFPQQHPCSIAVDVGGGIPKLY
jgi:hypothetical protein